MTDARTRAALARRGRRLSLDELVAGTLLAYPVYWDWERMGYTSCEAVMQQLVNHRMFPLTLEGLDGAMKELMR